MQRQGSEPWLGTHGIQACNGPKRKGTCDVRIRHRGHLGWRSDFAPMSGVGDGREKIAQLPSFLFHKHLEVA